MKNQPMPVDVFTAALADARQYARSAQAMADILESQEYHYCTVTLQERLLENARESGRAQARLFGKITGELMQNAVCDFWRDYGMCVRISSEYVAVYDPADGEPEF